MKKAYIVAGPESSGNRLLTALLVRAGCVGNASMEQHNRLPTYEDPVVLTRSYPHGNAWPDIREIYHALRDRGYMVRVIVPVRDPWCVVESQVGSQHHPRDLAEANVRRAYLAIFTQLAEINCWFTTVPVEALALHQAQAIRRLLESLELPTDNLGGSITVEGQTYDAITDMNARYYALA